MKRVFWRRHASIFFLLAVVLSILIDPSLSGRVSPAAAQTLPPLPGRNDPTFFPPAASTAFIQTSGPNGVSSRGNYYTVVGDDVGNSTDIFQIHVPCGILPPTTTITLDLFDPESYIALPVGPTTTIDEIMDNSLPAPVEVLDNAFADTTSFTLTSPSGVVLRTQVFPAAVATNEKWVEFATFQPASDGCGTYTLRARTDDNDENAWRFAVSPSNLDGIAGSGDELVLTGFETTFQHAGPGITCQRFYYFIDADRTNQRLYNFDMDPRPADEGPPTPAKQRISYRHVATGNPIVGSFSRSNRWNNPPVPGTRRLPKADNVGGDLIPPAEFKPGLWDAEFCVLPENQYIFDPAGPFLLQQPDEPEMIVSKDDGRTLVTAGETLTYTIAYTNVGKAAAHNVVLSDVVPPELTYLGCALKPCAKISDAPTVVTYTVGIVGAGQSGAVQLIARVKPDVISGTLITNAVTLRYTNLIGQRYPDKKATDIDTPRTPPPPPLLPNYEISKQVAKPAGRDIKVGDILTYTILLTNTGNTILDVIPLEDTFSSTLLGYLSATPTHDLTQTGLVRWNDLTVSFGRNLAPGETFAVTTFFQALAETPAQGALNDACAADPRDTLGNVAPRLCSSATITVPTPTAISLASLQAELSPAGGVQLSWRTSAEIDNYGFQVYRAAVPEAARAQLLTPEPIAGRGPGAQGGNSYRYNDPGGSQSDYYWLVDIDLAGQATWHGPLRAAPSVQSGAALWLPLVIMQ